MVRLSQSTGLPGILPRKIYKTSQSRGAELDEIYQNRVLRSSTVLIPLSLWLNGSIKPPAEGFENGYILITQPSDYVANKDELPKEVCLGRNLLIFYRLRKEWDDYPPGKFNWRPATSRTSFQGGNPPLGGHYVARVPSLTRKEADQIFQAFTDRNTTGVGAGIRVYEYASTKTCELTRYQLAFLAWRTRGMVEAASEEFGKGKALAGKNHVDDFCNANGLDDIDKLKRIRALKDEETICPLCLEPIEADELLSRLRQVEGREVPDLTVTAANMFHLEELKPGVYNHRIYNLAWGHHHCNTVTRDAGIKPTLNWMAEVLKNNKYTVKAPEA
ncbi:MAG: BstXI family restriction endonuclease [Candidatus Methylomirabilota bacterium]|jgi:hypothetical protein